VRDIGAVVSSEARGFFDASGFGPDEHGSTAMILSSDSHLRQEVARDPSGVRDMQLVQVAAASRIQDVLRSRGRRQQIGFVLSE
jgi:hypothetical protein